MTYTIISPLYVIVPRKTKSIKVLLNLNVYRNLHYRTSNDAKIVYKELFKDVLSHKKFSTPVEITYKIFKGSKRKLDKMNSNDGTTGYRRNVQIHSEESYERYM